MESLVGTSVGPYRVTKVLGQGGMGAVYEATHQQIGRRVAIKVLRTEHARDKASTTRLFNEARAVNRIEHPGLVQIFDCDVMADGSAYLVMELLIGETLTERFSRNNRRLSEVDAMRIIFQLATILDLTHKAGIVHRDLKPGNIMLVKDPDVPGGERVKLLDFGIAKLVSVAEGPGENLTNPEIVFGTPAYMSPEQIRRASTTDGKADVYSLGVIFFELLAGRPPFVGQGVGVIAMVLVEEPPALREFAPGISDSVAALIDTMLKKERTERPTMAEIADTLRPRVISEIYQGSTNLPVMGLGRSGAYSAMALGSDPPTGPQQPTTLGGSIGQQIVPSHRRSLLLGLAIGVLTLAGGIFVTLALQHGPQGGTTAQTRVHWSIVTEPPGATVSTTPDGRVLGTTPWTSEEQASEGTLRVRLHRTGLRPLELSIDRSRNAELILHLEPESPSPKGSPPNPMSQTPGAVPPAALHGTKPQRPGKRSPLGSADGSHPTSGKTKIVDD